MTQARHQVISTIINLSDIPVDWIFFFFFFFKVIVQRRTHLRVIGPTVTCFQIPGVCTHLQDFFSLSIVRHNNTFWVKILYFH